MSRRRKLLKWTVRVVVGLTVLALLALVGADRWRAQKLDETRGRLETSLARIDSEILDGRTPAEWQRSRVRGSNGWDRIQPVYLYAREAPDSELASAEYKDAAHNLLLYSWNDWREYPEDEGAEPLTIPPLELLTQWLSASEPLAELYASLLEYDCIASMPAENESYPWSGGTLVLPRLRAIASLMGRCRAWAALGELDRSWQELRTAAVVVAKWTAPALSWEANVNWREDQHVASFANEQLVDGQLTAARARELLGIRRAGPNELLEALRGDCAWFSVLARSTGFMLAQPEFMDWLTDRMPATTNMYDMNDMHESVASRWSGPVSYSKEMADALEGLLAFITYLESPAAWDPDAAPRVAKGEFAMSTIDLFYLRCRWVSRGLSWLRVELRAMELEGGPLAKQTDAVAQAVAKYPDVSHEFEGDNLWLRLEPGLGNALRAFSEDSATSGNQTLHLWSGGATLIEPIAIARTRPKVSSFD